MAKKPFNKTDYKKRLLEEKQKLNFDWEKIVDGHKFESQYVATVMQKLIDLDKRLLNENFRDLL